MLRVLSVLQLGLILAACDSPRDEAYYNAHRDEARAKVATCAEKELKSDSECKAAANVRATVLMEARRAMTERVCGLLTDAEAARFVGAEAHGGGAARPENDTSYCSWGPGIDLFVRVEIEGPGSFTQETPAGMFDDLVNGFRKGGVAFEELPGIGDKAILVINGGGVLSEDAAPRIMVVTVLKGDSWLRVTTDGLSRAQTIEAARIAAGRL